MDLKEQFEATIEKAKSLSSQSNETLLELYSLYKQATEGDVQGEAPSGFDFRGAAKYAAWEKRRGMTPDEAMHAYIDLVDGLE
jgi:acyl-CoA-binding protein